MSDEQTPKKPNLFEKALGAADGWLNHQILKAQNASRKEMIDEEAESLDFFYRKSVHNDMSYYVGNQGYLDKPYRLTNEHLKQMSLKDSVVSAIIVTRQSQISNYSKCVKNEHQRGFRIRLKDEDIKLEEIKDKLRDGETIEGENLKAESLDIKDRESSLEVQADTADSTTGQQQLSDDKVEVSEWELERKAKQILEKSIRAKKRELEEYIKRCGKMDDRPFSDRKWNFDSYLRATVRDSLTYDFVPMELIPDTKGDLHHFVPVDGSTIKYASPQLKNYKAFPIQSSYSFLYPEAELKKLEQDDALELDEEKLANDQYKYVQVIRGKIERAFTPDELAVGIRNITTDIYNNGYGIPELELLVGLVSSHLNTEFYNQAYFTQGFSAKGILHIKAPLSRRKLEQVRQQWHHMVRGARNSFQTPIFAGMDEVKWIPLTQNHSDIEFQGWMNYLIKMISAIYQIDPQEIGIGMKEEGSKGAGLSGDNTQEKIDQSKDRGLYPLLRFLENHINTNILDRVDADFYLEFTGIKGESTKESVDRQMLEAQFKKTVNEIREEDGLPPIPGYDDVIQGQVFAQIYQMRKGMEQMGGVPEMQDDEGNSSQDTTSNDDNFGKSMPIKIEYYKYKKE